MNAAEKRIIIKGRDTWSDATLDRIETAARGKIICTRDDGCGNMLILVQPNVRYVKAGRKAILDAVQQIAPSARWAS